MKISTAATAVVVTVFLIFLASTAVAAKSICIYTGYASDPWSPETYKVKSLGGSETAAMWLADSLAQRGHIVTVVGVVSPGVYSGVRYVTLKDSTTSFFERSIFDIVIVSRYVHFFLQYAPQAEQYYIWGHDVSLLPWWNGHTLPLSSYLYNLRNVITGVVTLTPWHRTLYHNTYPFISPDKEFIVGNGLNTEFFENSEDIVRDPYRLIWSSNPNRGLENVLKLIPALKAKIPQLTLHIFAHEAKEYTSEQRTMVESLKGTVFWRGPVPQRQLAKEILASSVWIYPTHFRETYCITALEMMAGGVIPFIVPYAGLHDVVKGKGVILKVPGFTGDRADDINKNEDWYALVNGMNTPQFVEDTVNSVLEQLNSPDLVNKRVELMQWAHSQSWSKRAQEWEYIFNSTNASINVASCDS